jgi:hypothetical protein
LVQLGDIDRNRQLIIGLGGRRRRIGDGFRMAHLLFQFPPRLFQGSQACGFLRHPVGLFFSLLARLRQRSPALALPLIT